MIELDYYPLAIAAEKTGYSKELLIYLAAEGKLPLFFRENGTEVHLIEFDIGYEADNFGAMSEYYQLINVESSTITKPYQISVETIQRYCNNRDVKLYGLMNPDHPLCEGTETRLKYPVPFKNIDKYVSAEDVARLSKKETVKNAFTDNERNTMLKLIIGMAINAYGYDPEDTRNKATGDKNGIRAKLQTHGINISDDTIRKYLKEAQNLL
jgi:hypothetical protein